ncbi:MAG: pyrroline-5-carboxylate reductase [Ruminococcaceae bacterium]|nr:pyrroline-5-carboxylate reductase [Oscillospiraceae bacterium]
MNFKTNGDLKLKKILFIGAGNMASAIANGLSKANIVDNENIILFDKNAEQYSKFNASFSHANDINEGINSSDYIFLSVKPQNVKEVLSDINIGTEGKVFISICAGITINSIEKSLHNAKIIRAMPNTPLLIGQGVTALCKNANVTEEEFAFVKSIFSSCGIITEIDEKDINALTAITSSSPAYVYTFIKGLLDGAKQLNFNYENTLELVCKTLIGSANMVLSSDKTIDEQIRMVKSPNGTTEKALNVLDENNFTQIIADAMKACENRAFELAELNK